VISYRHFTNFDPPRIAQIWNDSLGGRGAALLRMVAALERYHLAKLYFDPAGLILAFVDETPVGFVHAGFGPNQPGNDIDRSRGVICALVVRPPFRCNGIGSELVKRAEQYLVGRGATSLFAGPHWPLDPFFVGLYGGSDAPGFLISDQLAQGFFEKRGYTAIRRRLVYHRPLDRPLIINDPRFAELRKRYEVTVQPRVTLSNWWHENVVGTLEPLEIRVEDRSTRAVVGRTLCWEMEGYSWRWNVPAAGVLDFTIHEGLRRQGLGRFFLAHVLRYLQEQYFGVCEAHCENNHDAAIGLLTSLDFFQVDEGRIYQKQ
jgi:ribosomal protein S18 acetylase RimI-like enzyme